MLLVIVRYQMLMQMQNVSLPADISYACYEYEQLGFVFLQKATVLL